MGLICVFRTAYESVTGCTGTGDSGKDYCAERPSDNYLSYKANAGTENQTWFSYSPQLYLGELGLCEGDCDIDAHCADGFHCFRRSGLEPVDDGVTNCNGVGAQGKGASLFFFDCSLLLLFLLLIFSPVRFSDYCLPESTTAIEDGDVFE